MKLVFLGPPGSGKGTQSIKIAEVLEVPHLSTGDILRNEVKEKSEIGKQAEQIMAQGGLVSDEIVDAILRKKLLSPECMNGFVLDGTPRNMDQASLVDEIAPPDKAIFIEVSDEEVTKRISSRRVCPKDGESYSLTHKPPLVVGRCDVCGGELEHRADDRPESIVKRLETYHSLMDDVLQLYEGSGRLIRINGEQEIDKVYKEILDKLVEPAGQADGGVAPSA